MIELIKENWLYLLIYTIALILVWEIVKRVLQGLFRLVSGVSKSVVGKAVSPFKNIKVIIIMLISFNVITVGVIAYLIFR
jgi:hypothetical protein